MSAEDPPARPRPEHEVMGTMLAANAELVAGVLRGAGSTDQQSLARAIAATRSLEVLVEDTLRTLVAQAREAGTTWAEIGTLFGVSRQAAFQRFGAPGDDAGRPRGAARPVRGARAAARTTLDAFIASEFDAMRERFDARMLAACSVALLASVRAGLDGSAERGAPRVTVRDGYTVVDTPLRFPSAGGRTGRVVLDRAGRVAGFFLLGPDAP